jgi:hypothetical protein
VIYAAARDWVDRVLRWNGYQARAVVLPALVPALLTAVVGAGSVLVVLSAAWFVAWYAFVGWRYWLYMREVSTEADRQYDRVGKFQLAKEYHGTESATAVRDRKLKNG